MSRNQLSVASLDNFIAYCETLGWERQPTKGLYEAARMKKGKQTIMIHKRERNHAGTPLTHLTLCRHGEVLFWQWKRDRRT